MASSLICILLLIFANSAAVPAAAAAVASISIRKAYPAIFVFGDSLSDPGNMAIDSKSSTFRTIQLPYGETFPGHPFGRYSDGRTLVDFLAAYMDLPFVSAYLNSSADFSTGVNYAFGGATALNISVLSSLGISSPTNFSLDVQLALHLAYKASLDSSKGSSHTNIFEDGLYVIEIGGNDYAHAYDAKYLPSFIKSTLISLVISKIHNVVETLIDSGAKNFLFVSITPLGCSSCTLSQFDGPKDSDGCLEEYNLASYLHGVHLQQEVAILEASYPDASFLFLDYYGAYKYVLKQQESFGFVNTLEACCGAGDGYQYNYDPLQLCNANSIFVCTNPSAYMMWDGIHFTDSFNFQIFNQTFITGSFLDGPHATL